MSNPYKLRKFYAYSPYLKDTYLGGHPMICIKNIADVQILLRVNGIKMQHLALLAHVPYPSHRGSQWTVTRRKSSTSKHNPSPKIYKT
jgi:hypothetical protein